MAINRIPKNYYSDTNIRRDKINEIIDEVNDIASIPSPSAADAGKVVKVSGEGSYELAQDAGAKELIVTLSSDFTADKTYNEILAALNNGDIVKLVTWSEMNYIFSGTFADRICFACIDGHYNTGITDVNTIAVDDTNTWEMYLDTIEHLPTVTSADAGKVLGVADNGAWELDSKQVVIAINVPPEGNATFIDKTIDEIISLFNKGIPMIFKHNANIYRLRSINTTNKTLELVNFTVTSIVIYFQSISFNSQGIGTIQNVSVRVS